MPKGPGLQPARVQVAFRKHPGRAELASCIVQQVHAEDDDVRLVNGEYRGPWTERRSRQIAVGVQRYELRPSADLSLHDLGTRREGVGALAPRRRPEVVLLDVEQDTFERLSNRLADTLAPSGPPVVPAITHGKREGQELAVVGGETDAVSAFSTTQLSLGKPRLEGDTSFSKELDDLGGRHVASIDATCSTADPLSGRPFEICTHRQEGNDGSTATTSRLHASKGDVHVITGAYVLDFINLGNDAMDADDLATAEKYFRAAAAAGNADAHFNLGNLLTQQGQLERAAEHLSRAWAMGAVEAALNLGLVLQTLHRNDEAEAAFRNGWKAGDERAGQELAWSLHEKGDTHAARQVFRKMSREKSYLGRQAAGVLGTWAEMNGKRNKKTLERLKRGLWAYQDAAPALAAILTERGDFEKARDLLEEHIAYSPRASVRLGNLLMDHFNDRQGAEAAFLIGVAASDAHAKDNLDELRASLSAGD